MATIITRAGKGSPLTNAEVDANFSNLNTELGQKLVASANLSDIADPAEARTNLGLNEVLAQFLQLTGGTLTGNLAFSGTGRRITGDFSNATISNRLLFQSSTTNGQTLVAAIPNGTAVNSQFQAYNSSDPNNSSIAALVASASQVRIVSGFVGTGTLNPITFIFGNTEAGRFATSGNFLLGTTTDDGVNKLQITGGVALNSGTPNGLLFLNGSKVVSSGAGLTFDGANLGIGVAPSHVVDVFSANNGVVQVRGGPAANQGGAFFVRNAANTATFFAIGDRARIFGGTPDQTVSIFTSGAPLTLDIAGATKATLDITGNLFLGATPSGHLAAGYGGPMFQVGGRASVLGSATTSAYTNNVYYAAGFFRYIGDDEATMLEQLDGVFRWYSAPSGITGQPIDFGAVKMSLDTLGALTVLKDVTAHGVTVGRGGGAVATNTALGVGALSNNISGSLNTAIGSNIPGFSYAPLQINTTGFDNTATGSGALSSNQTGNENSAFGVLSLFLNSSGSQNTAVGDRALYASTTASKNTAVGYLALSANSTFPENTAVGHTAMRLANGGIYQSALGAYAGYSLTTGTGNTFLGAATGYSSTTGSFNTFVGVSQGYYGAGYYITTGSKNTILGGFSGNQGGLDIRTANNYIVLSDGDGNPRLIGDGAGNWGGGVVPAAWNTGLRAIQVGYSAAVDSPTSVANTRWSNNAFVDASGAFKYIRDGVAQVYEQTASGQHVWRTAAPGLAGALMSPTQAMTLDAAGYLLVGAASSSGVGAHRLQVGSSGVTAQFLLKCGGGHAAIYASGPDVYQTWASGGFLAFGAAPADGSTFAEFGRFSPGGSLLIGTPSGAFTGRVVALQTTSASEVYTVWNSATTGDNSLIGFYTDGGVGRGSVTYNRAGGLVSYNTTSDYRSKDILGPVANSGEVIDALRVYTGRMKGATLERPMLIAHEAQAVTPYAVTGEKDALTEDGAPLYQQMDHQALVPLLIAELQSLRARVAALELH